MMTMRAFITYSDDSCLRISAYTFSQLVDSINAQSVVADNLGTPITRVTIYTKDVVEG